MYDDFASPVFFDPAVVESNRRLFLTEQKRMFLWWLLQHCLQNNPQSAGEETVLQHHQDALEDMFNKSRMGTQKTLDTITAEMSLIIRCLSHQTKGTRPNSSSKQHPLTGVGAHAYGTCCCCVFLLFTHRQGYKRGRIRNTSPPNATDIPTTHHTSCHIVYRDKCCA